jgi:hypothetical protein
MLDVRVERRVRARRQVTAKRGINALFGAEANDRALEHHTYTLEERNRTGILRLRFGDNAPKPHLVKGVPKRNLNRFRGVAATLIFGQQRVGHFDVLSVMVLVK